MSFEAYGQYAGRAGVCLDLKVVEHVHEAGEAFGPLFDLVSDFFTLALESVDLSTQLSDLRLRSVTEGAHERSSAGKTAQHGNVCEVQQLRMRWPGLCSSALGEQEEGGQRACV